MRFGGEIVALGVTFKLSDLVEAFELMDKPALPTPTTESPPEAKAKGGRPTAVWWEDLWVEIAAQLYAGDLDVKRQADIEEAMLEWIEGRGHSASQSTVRERARKLFKAIMGKG